MAAAAVDLATIITSVPGVRGGRPIIAGTGVSVQRVVLLWKHGSTPEDIARRMDHLSLGQIYAALAYYHLNQERIDADIATEDAEYERLMQEQVNNGPTFNQSVNGQLDSR